MGECLIKRIGGIDVSDLTALPSDVVAPYLFYGANTDDIQSGNIKNNGKIQKNLDINETYSIPSGYIEEGSYVTQNIEKKGDVTVIPTAGGTFADVINKYMTGNVKVSGVENLLPENIKAGVSIGTVSGEWQGYVNEDELCPYWYGIFGPGQSGSVGIYKTPSIGTTGDYTIHWKQIVSNFDKDPNHPIAIHLVSWMVSGRYTCWGIFFQTPIEMAGVKSVTILYKTTNWYQSDRNRLFLCENTGTIYDENWNIKESIGYNESFVLPVSESGYSEVTFNITNPNRLRYVCVGIGIPPTSDTGRGIIIISIKLNK